MARKKVREYDAKRILRAAFQRMFGVSLPINVVQVKEGQELSSLAAGAPWLTSTKLVVKPGKTGGMSFQHATRLFARRESG